ncbi:MAG: endolytic transglycosylase MltG, partial [Chloroflexota bacterium]|nr:endolytic transglycosylase MltG [Chloroflexota bacterium]
IIGWAYDSPSALALPFVKDLVKDDLGTKLTTAPSADSTQIEFVVSQGDTAAEIATRLAAQGFLLDARAFVFTAIERNLADKLESGTFILRKNMTPDQLVTGLLQVKDLAIDLPFREGLRLEQVVTKLETLPVKTDIEEFYRLAKKPTAAILAKHPWLDLPKGASLEGFLAPATYHVLPDITAEELINKMLDTFYKQVGETRMNVAKSRGLTFYQVLTLASLVEREAILDSERPTIAGVYQNRLDPKKWPTGLLQADPTVFYGHDTEALAKLSLAQWPQYAFWTPFDQQLKNVKLPAALQGYQSYQTKGLPPTPICTPTVASIDAALKPNTANGYLFFLAKHDGSNGHAFAKTQAEHEKNLKKYGYIN